MISSVSGTVAVVMTDAAVVEVGGVGLAVQCTPSTLASLRPGESVRLATALVVREDSLTLFGFASDDDHKCHQTLAVLGLAISPGSLPSYVITLSSVPVRCRTGW